MKLTIVLLSVALIASIVSGLFFLWKSIDAAITVDHMGVEIARCHKRGVALLRLSRRLSAGVPNETLKAFIRTNMQDLEITEVGEQVIVNGVEIRFDTTPLAIE